MGGILFEDLNLRFQEVWRHYHGLSHIETMLDELDAFRAAEESKMVHFAAVKMMVWYHDAVYYPYAPRNNETQSARLFALVGKLAYLQEPFITRVVEGILATANHKQSENSNIRTLCDIDLAILGQPEPVFDRYEAQIRLEYDAVLGDQFRMGRRTILKHFFNRQRIYQTDFFRERYEVQARKNLRRSIESLS
jgi:predicted metal-dependent HD superfamily phosphohydrolase